MKDESILATLRMLEAEIEIEMNESNLQILHHISQAKTFLRKRITEAEIKERGYELDGGEKWLVEAGKPIDAIKRFRARSGCSLSTAKVVMENYRNYFREGK